MSHQVEPRSWSEKLGIFIESTPVQRVIITLIIINAIILGLETSQSLMQQWGGLLRAIDTIILMIFVVEIVLRIIAHRLSFFRDPWSLFDFTVVAIALVPASGPLAVLRALRVLRVLRLLTMVPSMRRVIGGMVAAIPGLGSVMAIMMVIFYVSAVIATNLFGEQFPDWFGSLAATGYTLFQVMTLESWSMGIVRPVMEVYPDAWIFFITFILIATFTMLNLFIAVIVNAVQMEQHGEFEINQQVVTTRLDEDTLILRNEISSLRSEIQEIKAMLQR
ncbi:Voltage-gated sodium channel subunit [hydrothermal vent metagenome]|uniref:Voltage-gated sodium channel subunit n=1 Tax=hydrothermal vent metagenome TaxID=652676 RepID=A0A3B1AR61_9ZZZZ